MQEFRCEFLNAWNAGASHEVLLNIAARFEPIIGPREMYEILQAIWQERGYDDCDDDDPLRDELEFVMEKIWYRCPA